MMTISKFKDILKPFRKKAKIPFSTIAYVFVDPPPPPKKRTVFRVSMQPVYIVQVFTTLPQQMPLCINGGQCKTEEQQKLLEQIEVSLFKTTTTKMKYCKNYLKLLWPL